MDGCKVLNACPECHDILPVLKPKTSNTTIPAIFQLPQQHCMILVLAILGLMTASGGKLPLLGACHGRLDYLFAQQGAVG